MPVRGWLQYEAPPPSLLGPPRSPHTDPSSPSLALNCKSEGHGRGCVGVARAVSAGALSARAKWVVADGGSGADVSTGWVVREAITANKRQRIVSVSIYLSLSLSL